jgi:hypothetical protein
MPIFSLGVFVALPSYIDMSPYAYCLVALRIDAVEVSFVAVVAADILTFILRVQLDTAGGRSQCGEEHSSSGKVLHTG